MIMLEFAEMSQDLIIVNGDIRTQDPSRPRANAVACQAGEVVFVGDNEEALATRTTHTVVIDAIGRLVLPGFTDSHIHFTGFAQSLSRVGLEGCRSIEEAVSRVAARVSTAAVGETIYGWGWNHLDWNTAIFPDKRPLDEVAPSNPVILTRKDGHSAWVNSAALRKAGITRETPNPEGGFLERGVDGDPNGLVRENALELLGRGIGKSDEAVSEAELERAIAMAHRAGLTTIHNIEGANALRAWQLLHNHGKLKLRVVHSIPWESLENAVALDIERGFGDRWLRLQAVKLFADGSLGSQTAEMSEPYVGGEKYGMVLTDPDTMLRMSRAAALGGFDVWIHAIGDSAISRTLDMYQVLRAEGLGTGFRIEHVQHLNPRDLSRFARLNVIASMQPIHQPSDMRMADILLGEGRARWTYAFNSLRNAGATLAFGSDCPVERFDPVKGIHAAVARQNESGDPPGGWFPEERLSVQAAVEGFTRGAAIAAGDTLHSGSIAIGHQADAVILSRNIYEIPPDEIRLTEVDYTIVGGEVVCARGS
jgi:predicted amidohydrolase YtcJ